MKERLFQNEKKKIKKKKTNKKIKINEEEINFILNIFFFY
jgi:hypothetical protein